MTPNLRPRSQRYQDFILGVSTAASADGIDYELAAKMIGEIADNANTLESQINSYKKQNGELEDLATLIFGYYHNRAHQGTMPEWMTHAGLPEKL